MGRRLSPATIYVLKGLMPYTRANLQLAFSPNRFFNELEKQSRFKKSRLRSSYYHAREQKLITDDPIPKLTAKGRQRLQPFIASKLSGNGRLMVIFDIPEGQAHKRRQLRMLLRSLSFEQVQQSVWVTKFDHREVIIEACRELELEGYVQLHESALIFS